MTVFCKKSFWEFNIGMIYHVREEELNEETIYIENINSEGLCTFGRRFILNKGIYDANHDDSVRFIRDVFHDYFLTKVEERKIKLAQLNAR